MGARLDIKGSPIGGQLNFESADKHNRSPGRRRTVGPSGCVVSTTPKVGATVGPRAAGAANLPTRRLWRSFAKRAGLAGLRSSSSSVWILKFVTASTLDRRIEQPAVLFARDPDELRKRLADSDPVWPDMSPEWFEARVWVWLHYAAAKLARGELFEALGMLAFFREQVLGPMLHRRAGRSQRGVRRVEMFALDSGGMLEATLARNDAEAIEAAIRHALAAYLDLREDAPPAQATEIAPRALLEMLDAHRSERGSRMLIPMVDGAKH